MPILTTGAGTALIAVALPAVTFISTATTTGTGGTVITAASANIGTANANRRVILMVSGGQNGRTLSSATINGVSCDATSIGNMAGGTGIGELYTASAVVASGTTGVTITLTYSSAIFTNPFIGIYTVDNTTLSSIVPVTAFSQSASGTTNTLNVATLAGGFVLTGLFTTTGTSASTASGTETYTTDASAVSATASFAHANAVSANASSAVTWNWTTSSLSAMGAAAFR